MNIEEIREYCLSKDLTEEGFPFGEETLVLKVNNKIFCLIALDENPVRMNLKCNPEKAIELREKFHYVIPGYHMNKKHWNTIICEEFVSERFIKDLIDHSYELVAKKSKK